MNSQPPNEPHQRYEHDSQEAVRSPSMHSYDAGFVADTSAREYDNESYVSLKMQSDSGRKRQKRSEVPNLLPQFKSDENPFSASMDEDVTSYSRIMPEREQAQRQ